MKKVFLMVVVAMMTAMSMSLTSCAEQEEGESNEDWILRNVINGPTWHVDMILDDNGNWVRWEDAALFNSM